MSGLPALAIMIFTLNTYNAAPCNVIQSYTTFLNSINSFYDCDVIEVVLEVD